MIQTECTMMWTRGGVSVKESEKSGVIQDEPEPLGKGRCPCGDEQGWGGVVATALCLECAV